MDRSIYLLYPFGSRVRATLLQIGDDLGKDLLSCGNVVVRLPREPVAGCLVTTPKSTKKKQKTKKKERDSGATTTPRKARKRREI